MQTPTEKIRISDMIGELVIVINESRIVVNDLAGENFSDRHLCMTEEAYEDGVTRCHLASKLLHQAGKQADALERVINA